MCTSLNNRKLANEISESPVPGWEEMLNFCIVLWNTGYNNKGMGE